jgi:NADH:ubiquinone oxidoreductase subunit 2 (subunit N)
MYEGLGHAHSGLRWIVLLLLILAVGIAFRKLRSGRPFGDSDRRFALFALIATHLQLVLGLILYFISPNVQFISGMMKDPILRFYTVEHISLMLIAIALITIGYSKAKRRETADGKFRAIATYYSLGLVLILVAIPWPFRELGAGWI